MTDINVFSRTQKIIVDPVTSSVAVINAGPVGPAGPEGVGGGVVDGNKGDITVSDDGDTWEINNGAVTAAKVASDVATQAELNDHLSDSIAAHAASSISFTPAGIVTATDVQAAITQAAAAAGEGGGAEHPLIYTPEKFQLGRYDVPTFVRQPTYLLHVEDSGFDSLFFPCVINVTGKIASPVATYYMFYSTDHDPGLGGIGVAYANNPLGPFTADEDNPIYTDPDVTVDQTETPTVMWNEETEKFHLFYQIHAASGGGSQRTRVVTTEDFITFDTAVEALGAPSQVSYPGDGMHTGYFFPQKIGNTWFGYSLLTSGDYSSTGMWHSRNGLEWWLDPRPMGWASDLFNDEDHLEKWSGNTLHILEINGRNWLMSAIVTFQSGVTDYNAAWLMAPLSHDGRRFVGQPIDVTPPYVAWEDSNRQPCISILVENDVIYAYYVAEDASSDKAIGVAVGSLP